MNTTDATHPTPESVDIPMHLLPLLQVAADDQLELACDIGGDWTPEIRDRILRAARVVDELDSGSPTPSVIEHLAARVQVADEPPMWPSTIAEATTMLRQVGAMRQLMVLRAKAREARA